MKFDRKVSEYVEFAAPRFDFPLTIKCSASSVQSPYAGEPPVLFFPIFFFFLFFFFSIEFPNAAVWYRKNVHVAPTMRAKRIFSVDLSIGVVSCSLDLILCWFSFFLFFCFFFLSLFQPPSPPPLSSGNIVASGSALLKE